MTTSTTVEESSIENETESVNMNTMTDEDRAFYEQCLLEIGHSLDNNNNDDLQNSTWYGQILNGDCSNKKLDCFIKLNIIFNCYKTAKLFSSVVMRSCC